MKLRTLTIIILAILVAAGFVFYFLTRQKGAAPTTTSGTTGTLPGATTQTFPANATTSAGTSTPTGNAAATFGIISNDPTLDYFIDPQNIATIIEPNGTIETISNGQTTVISSTTISNIITASFSYDGKKIMVNSGAATNPKTSIFDVTTRSWLSLPQGMQNPVWSPSDYQIAYFNNIAPGTESIYTGTLSTTTIKTSLIQTLNMLDSTLQWPSKNAMIVADRPSAFTVGSALYLAVSTKTIIPLVVEYTGMESLWSNSAPMTGLVFFGNNGNQGGSLSLINIAGVKKALTFSTLPSKCAFHQDLSTSTQIVSAPTSTKSRSATGTATSTTVTTTMATLNLYCAIPRDQNTFGIARLPDEYDQKMFLTADDFYEIGAASGTINTVFADPNQTLDATDLKLSNNILFFVNRYDQKLYAIKLGNGG